MKRLRLLLLPALLFTQLGCIWDRDTLASELAGRADAAKIIAGWFDRNPPEYYQMRLDRVTTELATNPDQLALYDDAAVACDRLGKPGDAIAWMTKKQGLLHLEPPNAPQPNHHYRTLANLGTFHAHRWIKNRLANPEAPVDFADLQKAETLIAQAIKDNPDAHFGREKYQLLAIQWLQLDDVELFSTENPLGRLTTQPPMGTTRDRGYLRELGIPDAVDGLSGMIELGAGWESVDLFLMLGRALQAEGRSQPAAMAMLRVKELRTAGRTSIHPSKEESIHYGPGDLVQDDTALEAYYTTAKTAAEQRHLARTGYITTRLARGEHPDTHPAFWVNWSEPEFPKAPRGLLGAIFKTRSSTIITGIGIMLASVLIVATLVSILIKSRRASS